MNTIEKLQKLTQFLRSPKEALLYAQVNTIKNMFLLDSRVRQPLLNGFEFNKFTDVGLSLLLNKQSSKTDTSAKREFKINNFYRFLFFDNFYNFIKQINYLKIILI